jgi:transcriptional regulator with XRE-family HTH domain
MADQTATVETQPLSRAARRLRAALTREADQALPETQAELARALGVTKGAVSGWCSGECRPSLERMLVIERLYGIAVAEWVETEEAAAREAADA